jgi:hypothetical protein
MEAIPPPLFPPPAGGTPLAPILDPPTILTEGARPLNAEESGDANRNRRTQYRVPRPGKDSRRATGTEDRSSVSDGPMPPIPDYVLRDFEADWREEKA